MQNSKIKKRLFIGTAVLVGCLVFFGGEEIFAETKPIDFVPLDGTGVTGFTDPETTGSLGGLLDGAYKFLISIASVLAVVMIFYAGFRYATTSSSSAKADAQKRIIGALGGLGLALSSWLILKTIDTDLVNVTLDFVGFKEGHPEFSFITEEGRTFMVDEHGMKVEVSSDSGRVLTSGSEGSGTTGVEDYGLSAGQNTPCGYFIGTENVSGAAIAELRSNVFPAIAANIPRSKNITPRMKPGARYGISASQNSQPFRGIVVHGNDLRASAAATADYGQNSDGSRGGSSFGYHFVISRGGQIYQAAPYTKRTNHAKGYNTHHIGISFARTLGDKTSGGCPKGVYAGTVEQYKSLAFLAWYLKNEKGYAITGNAKGHGEVSGNRKKGEGYDGAVLLREFVYSNI